jgi:predicted DNA-binding transcriptional regulator AlpA
MTTRIQPPVDVLLTEQQVAEMLSLSRATLAGWRFRGLGPHHIRLSRRAVRYKLSTIEAWITDHQRSSTSDPGEQVEGRHP